MKIEIKNNRLSAVFLLAFSLFVCFLLASQFLSMRTAEPIYPGPGVTDIKMLSEWYPTLKETAGDTQVYILGGKKEG